MIINCLPLHWGLAPDWVCSTSLCCRGSYPASFTCPPVCPLLRGSSWADANFLKVA